MNFYEPILFLASWADKIGKEREVNRKIQIYISDAVLAPS